MKLIRFFKELLQSVLCTPFKFMVIGLLLITYAERFENPNLQMILYSIVIISYIVANIMKDIKRSQTKYKTIIVATDIVELILVMLLIYTFYIKNNLPEEEIFKILNIQSRIKLGILFSSLVRSYLER